MVCVFIDIGECLIGSHNCSQECLELPGRFDCGCFPGYELQEDGVTCEGSKCTAYVYIDIAHFNQILTNAPGTYQDVVKAVGTQLEASFAHVMMGLNYIMMILPIVLVCDHWQLVMAL